MREEEDVRRSMAGEGRSGLEEEVVVVLVESSPKPSEPPEEGSKEPSGDEGDCVWVLLVLFSLD